MTRLSKTVTFPYKKHTFLYHFFFIQAANGTFVSSRNRAAVTKEAVMIENNSARVLIGAMNLLAVGSPMRASQIPHDATAAHKIEKLNVASLKSIESTWLKVPNACKARGFNASPVSVENRAISAHIQNIYASFEV